MACDALRSVRARRATHNACARRPLPSPMRMRNSESIGFCIFNFVLLLRHMDCARGTPFAHQAPGAAPLPGAASRHSDSSLRRRMSSLRGCSLRATHFVTRPRRSVAPLQRRIVASSLLGASLSLVIPAQNLGLVTKSRHPASSLTSPSLVTRPLACESRRQRRGAPRASGRRDGGRSAPGRGSGGRSAWHRGGGGVRAGRRRGQVP